MKNPKRKPEPRKFIKKIEKPAEPEETRLNKYIANSGVCSRRDADKLIADGQVKVNGEVVREMGYKVKKTDNVKHLNKLLNPEKPRYVLLNKPKDFITTASDPKNRNTVMQLVEKACEERIYPVGRLDRQTTGLLLFTNDGDLAKKLTHPAFGIKKIYQVLLDKPITMVDFEAILKGLELEDGVAEVKEMATLGDDNLNLGIEIHMGKNRIVRRIFEAVGYRVEKLDRVMFGNLTKKNLPRGKWRHLDEKEIINLKNITSNKKTS